MTHLYSEAILLIKNRISTIVEQNNSQLAHYQQLYKKTQLKLSKYCSKKAKQMIVKIYGINPRCINQQSQFQCANNLKALGSILLEIGFQDQYVMNLIINQIQNSQQSFTKLKHYPYQDRLNSSFLQKCVALSLYNLALFCQNNPDKNIHEALSENYFSVQMLGLMLRAVLVKIKYPDAENYMNEQTVQKTLTIFTMLCEYFQLNLIPKNIKNKLNNRNGQVYLFADYNLFICTADSQQFVMGKYFDNQVQLIQAKNQISQSQIQYLLESKDNQDSNTDTQCKNAIKISQASFDLGMSTSGFMTGQQIDSPYFNSHTLTPQFGVANTFQSLRLRKSVEVQKNITNLTNQQTEKNKNFLAQNAKQIKNFSRIQSNLDNSKQNILKFQQLQEQKYTKSLIIDQNKQLLVDQKQNNETKKQQISAKKNERDSLQPQSPPTSSSLQKILQQRQQQHQHKMQINLQTFLQVQKKQSKEPNCTQFVEKLNPQQGSNENFSQEFYTLPEKIRYHRGSYNQVPQKFLTNYVKKSDITQSGKRQMQINTNNHQYVVFLQNSKLMKMMKDQKSPQTNFQKQKQKSYQTFEVKSKSNNKKQQIHNKSISNDNSQKSHSPKCKQIKKNRKMGISSNVVSVKMNIEPKKLGASQKVGEKKFQSPKKELKFQLQAKFNTDKNQTIFHAKPLDSPTMSKIKASNAFYPLKKQQSQQIITNSNKQKNTKLSQYNLLDTKEIKYSQKKIQNNNLNSRERVKTTIINHPKQGPNSAQVSISNKDKQIKSNSGKFPQFLKNKTKKKSNILNKFVQKDKKIIFTEQVPEKTNKPIIKQVNKDQKISLTKPNIKTFNPQKQQILNPVVTIQTKKTQSYHSNRPIEHQVYNSQHQISNKNFVCNTNSTTKIHTFNPINQGPQHVQSCPSLNTVQNKSPHGRFHSIKYASHQNPVGNYRTQQPYFSNTKTNYRYQQNSMYPERIPSPKLNYYSSTGKIAPMWNSGMSQKTFYSSTGFC